MIPMKYEMYMLLCLFVALFRLPVIGCRSDFSSSVLNVWIGRCTLHINYTRPAGNDTCSPRNYRVIVGSEHGDIITQTDTDILKYSYYDINSTSQYTVNVQPAFLCKGSIVMGERRNETILASIDFPEQTITANESTNVFIICPIHGAYKTINVIEWRHTINNNSIEVRNFTTPTISLVDVKYEDSGTYFYTAQYQECGFRAGKLMQKKGFVRVNFHGPPIISTVERTIDGNAEDKPTYLIKVISFPKSPNHLIMIENQRGFMLEVKCSKVVRAVFPYPLHGKVLDVEGYQMTLGFENVTNKWLNEFFTVYVSNDFGARGLKVGTEERNTKMNTIGAIATEERNTKLNTIGAIATEERNTKLNTIAAIATEERNTKLNTIESFINMNAAVVFGLGGGVLFVVITSGIAICCIRKKRNAICELQRIDSSKAQGDNTIEVVDSLYSPHEAPYPDGDCTYNQYNQKRLERERQQIASMYSFGGFSLGEFQEEDNTYNNDAYIMINQNNGAVTMNQ